MTHPRDVYGYEGGEAAEHAFVSSLERGRLHHAWLLTGPEGVGKATFAYRAARRLLGAAPDAEHGVLGARPSDPVSRQVAAQSHPDLMVLERVGRLPVVRREAGCLHRKRCNLPRYRSFRSLWRIHMKTSGLRHGRRRCR